MVYIKKIQIEEFKNKIYDRYTKIFPEKEQRDFEKIKKTYNAGLENFYKICLEDNTIIGFFMLGKISNHPYYLEYFAIYDEYQNKGYGSESLKYLLKNIVKNDGVIGEIEKVTDKDKNTKRRLKLYESLGFKLLESEYIVTGVHYNTIASFIDTKENFDKYFFDYYKINFGKDCDKVCKIIK